MTRSNTPTMIGLALATILAAASLSAQAQSPAAAAANARPAIPGAQDGTQPKLQQGGLALDKTPSAQVQMPLARKGQEDMPVGSPAALPSMAASAPRMAASATANNTGSAQDKRDARKAATVAR